MLRNTLFGLCATFCLALLIQAALAEECQCPYTEHAWNYCPQSPQNKTCAEYDVEDCPPTTEVAVRGPFICVPTEEYTQCHDHLCYTYICWHTFECEVRDFLGEERCQMVEDSSPEPSYHVPVKTTSSC